MAIKRKYNQISLGTKQYLTLIQSSINPPSIILSQQFFTNLPSPYLYRTEKMFWKLRDATTLDKLIRSILESTKCTR